MSTPKPTEVLFFRHVLKTETCWLWTGAKNKGGYGCFSIRLGTWNHKQIDAHRASWIVHFGEIPKGKWVLHTCDVRACVNPDHLFIGDRRANIDDMVSKKRNIREESHPMAKLTKRDVEFIHRSPMSHKELGTKFGVYPSHVKLIREGKRWKDSADGAMRGAK